MCGRFTFAQVDNKKVVGDFHITMTFDSKGKSLKDTQRFRESFNIAPGSDQLAIIKNSPNTGRYMRWGFKPAWFDRGEGVINARAETANEKPMFKKAFASQRCLIPATGFYEWAKIQQDSKPEKVPYFITLTNHPLFAFAGIYDVHKDAGGVEHYSFAIMTTEPNSLMEKIHNRMPVIIDKADYDEWLDAGTKESVVRKMCVPYASAKMKAYIVSKNVNSPVNDRPDLILPI